MVRMVKGMVFPVVMCGCENWTIKKAEHQRMDAFELWCWRRLLRVLWTSEKSNQSVLKKISPGRTDVEYSLEGLMLKLTLQYFHHLMQRAHSLKRPWCWGRLMARGEDGLQGIRWLDSITDSVNMNRSKLYVGDSREQGSLACCSHGVTKSHAWLGDWTTKRKATRIYFACHSPSFPPLTKCQYHISWL